MLQLFSMQRRRTSSEGSGENSAAGRRQLLDLILTFNANSDGSSDDGGETSSQGDLFG